MKMFVYISLSHKEMFEQYFYPSYKRFIEPSGVTLEIEYGDQVCMSATYNGKGSHNFWDNRLKKYYWQLEKTIEDIIVFVDADVIFLNDNIIDSTIEGLENNYVMFARDKHFNICAGFQAYKVCDASKEFLSEVISILPFVKNDQVGLNKLKHFILHKKYDWNDVYSIYHYNHKVWDGKSRIIIPHNISCFHANWTIGVENKMKLLYGIKKGLDF